MKAEKTLLIWDGRTCDVKYSVLLLILSSVPITNWIVNVLDYVMVAHVIRGVYDGNWNSELLYLSHNHFTIFFYGDFSFLRNGFYGITSHCQ